MGQGIWTRPYSNIPKLLNIHNTIQYIGAALFYPLSLITSRSTKGLIQGTLKVNIGVGHPVGTNVHEASVC
jgi:hypothetical protein